MKRVLLLFFLVVAALCAGVANASTVSVDEKADKTWSPASFSFAEDGSEHRHISFAEYALEDHTHERWENRFDFDRNDRPHRRFDCEPPSTVPIPGSIILFLSGIAAFIGVAHKKKV